jgi:hypothetical protein
VDGRLASSNLSESVAEELEDDQRLLGELNQMWTAKEISTAEYRKMRKEITDRIAKAQRKVVVRPMVLLDGLTGAGARAAWDAEDMTDERRNAVLRFLFSGVVIDEPKKFGPVHGLGPDQHRAEPAVAGRRPGPREVPPGVRGGRGVGRTTSSRALVPCPPASLSCLSASGGDVVGAWNRDRLREPILRGARQHSR